MTTPATPATGPDAGPQAIDPRVTATGQLFMALASDPKYRGDVLKLIKRAAPDTPMPELDLQDQLVASLDGRLKPHEDTLKKVNERLEAIDRKLTRDSWRTEHDLSNEELIEVEELAKKEQIPNGSLALELWQLRNQVGTPRSTRKAPEGTQEYLAKLHKTNPRDQKSLKVLAMDEANRIFSALRPKAR